MIIRGYASLTELRTDEALRFLRMKDFADMNAVFERCSDRVLAVLRQSPPRYVYREYSEIPAFFTGNAILKRVEHCERILVFAATLGSGIDRLIQTSNFSDGAADSVVIDALAGAAIEQVCDFICEMFCANYKNHEITKRFSPGYVDFPLEKNLDLLRELDTARKIGLSSTGAMMIPGKSVTAIVGAKKL